jgi:hypothetical protein
MDPRRNDEPRLLSQLGGQPAAFVKKFLQLLKDHNYEVAADIVEALKSNEENNRADFIDIFKRGYFEHAEKELSAEQITALEILWENPKNLFDQPLTQVFELSEAELAQKAEWQTAVREGVAREIRPLKKQNKALLYQIDDLVAELEEAQRDLSRIKERNQERDVAASTIERQQIDELTNQVEQLTAALEAEKRKKSLPSSSQELKELKEKLQEVRSYLTDAELRNDDLAEKNDAAAKKIALLEKENAQLKKEKAATLKQTKTAGVESEEEFATDRDLYKARVQELEERLAEKQARLEELEERLARGQVRVIKGESFASELDDAQKDTVNQTAEMEEESLAMELEEETPENSVGPTAQAEVIELREETLEDSARPAAESDEKEKINKVQKEESQDNDKVVTAVKLKKASPWGLDPSLTESPQSLGETIEFIVKRYSQNMLPWLFKDNPIRANQMVEIVTKGVQQGLDSSAIVKMMQEHLRIKHRWFFDEVISSVAAQRILDLMRISIIAADQNLTPEKRRKAIVESAEEILEVLRKKEGYDNNSGTRRVTGQYERLVAVHMILLLTEQSLGSDEKLESLLSEKSINIGSDLQEQRKAMHYLTENIKKYAKEREKTNYLSAPSETNSPNPTSWYLPM